MQASKAAPARRSSAPAPSPALAAEVRQSAVLLGLVVGGTAVVTALASALQWLA